MWSVRGVRKCGRCEVCVSTVGARCARVRSVRGKRCGRREVFGIYISSNVHNF